MSVCYEILDFRLLLTIKVLKNFLIALSNQTLQLLSSHCYMPFVDQIIENSRPRVRNIVLITSK